MSSQRVTTALPVEERSAHPAIRGVPWWAAILIAVAATLVGAAVDAAAGNGELTAVFATCYVIGCIAAVLAVRHTGIFTAVVQPPLILFATIPGAYYLLHSSEIAGVKDLVINCFYPLIERFGLMFFTALVVLLIGVARWYLESAKHRGAAAAITAAGGVLAGLGSRVRGLFASDDAEPRSGSSGRAPRNPARKRPAARPPRQQRPGGQSATRSRHARPPMDDPHAPEHPPRRRRPPQPRDGETPMPPRRRRVPRDPEYRREPWAPEPWDPEPWQPRRASDYPDRPLRTDRYGVDPYDLYGTPDDDAAGSRLPSSNVRYRGGDAIEDDTDYRRPRR